MADPKPVVITTVGWDDYDGPAPRPLVAVGGLPGGGGGGEGGATGVIALGTSDPVPDGTPAGTIILRS